MLLPESTGKQRVDRGQKSRRMQFLFLYSYGVQLAFMWLLLRRF